MYSSVDMLLQTKSFSGSLPSEIEEELNRFLFQLREINLKRKNDKVYTWEYVDIKYAGNKNVFSALLIVKANFLIDDIDKLLSKITEDEF